MPPALSPQSARERPGRVRSSPLSQPCARDRSPPPQPPPRQTLPQRSEARCASDKSARQPRPADAPPRKPKPPAQTPPQRSIASLPRSTAAAAPDPTSPQGGSSHCPLHRCKPQCLHPASRRASNPHAQGDRHRTVTELLGQSGEHMKKL